MQVKKKLTFKVKQELKETRIIIPLGATGTNRKMRHRRTEKENREGNKTLTFNKNQNMNQKNQNSSLDNTKGKIRKLISYSFLLICDHQTN